MTTLEDTPTMLRRRRLVAQLEILPEITLSIAQDLAIDSLCELLPLTDEPNILGKLAEADKTAAIALLKVLPQTHVITRIMEGRWPQ